MSKLRTIATFEVDLGGFYFVAKLNFLTLNSILKPGTTEIQEECKLSHKDLWGHPETPREPSDMGIFTERPGHSRSA